LCEKFGVVAFVDLNEGETKVSIFLHTILFENWMDNIKYHYGKCTETLCDTKMALWKPAM